MKGASAGPISLLIALYFSSALFAQQAQPAAPVPSIQAQNAPATQLTIAGIFAEGGVTGRAPESIAWSPDGNRVSYILRDDSGEHGQLWYVDLRREEPAILVASEKLASLAPPEAAAAGQTKDDREKERRSRYSVAAYHWAPDSQHLLFESKGQLWLYRLLNGTAIQLTSSSDPLFDPKFSPDGSRISYVRKHNLYVHPLNGERETPLTTSKNNDDNILNGEVDWVYAEELDARSNYFWSPDGKRIAYLQMNETTVPEYPITDFIPTHPTVDKQKYPNAGDPNPEVRIGVVDAGGGHQHWIRLSPELDKNKDYYIPRFGWINKDLLYAQVLNRAQNQLDLYFIDAGSGRSQLALSEKSDTWIEVNDNFRVLRSGDRFLWSGWRNGHTHLCLYSFNPGAALNAPAKFERQLTQGDFEVMSVNGVDEAAGTVYFTANKDDPRQHQLYAVKLDGGEMRKISQEEGTHQVTFSDQGPHYVDNFSALMTPPQLSLCDAGQGGCKAFWRSRDLAGFHLIKPQFVDFTAEDGTVLHGEILLPLQTSGKKVPVLLNPYGGPGAQQVRNAWGGTTFLFHQLLAEDGIAILQVDNRGMAGRGQKFASALRHNFGEVELKDQLTALDQALKQFPQLDADRLGWWGWSYGGYMTIYALTHSDRFLAGFAVAPVTDWKDYDSIYTERYMGLPKDNAEGYRKSSPVNTPETLHGDLVIVHGTSDDNVHMQNTIQMANAFINADKQFSLVLYPRKTHGIAGAAARTQLFTRIHDHFNRTLLGAGAKAVNQVEGSPGTPSSANSDQTGR